MLRYCGRPPSEIQPDAKRMRIIRVSPGFRNAKSRLHPPRLLQELHHAPRLRAGNRPALLDGNQIAFLAIVALVVRVIAARAGHDLAVERVSRAPLDEHGHRPRHLVAHDAAGELPLGGRFAHAFSFAFSAITVRTLAMSLRTLRSWLVLESCCVAFCMRRPNCARSNWASSCCSSSALLPLNSDAFTASTSVHARHDGRAQRQLGRSQAERLARFLLVDAVHF